MGGKWVRVSDPRTDWSSEYSIGFLPREIRNLFRERADSLYYDLKSNHLEVILVPAPEPRYQGHMIRTVVSKNPTWYQELNRTKSPFVISSIEYQDAQIDPDGNYKFLPLRMNITSSRDNFAKFLRYVETSGSILDNVRLMDIQSIHMSFGKDSGESVNFSVKIHAYFQNI